MSCACTPWSCAPFVQPAALESYSGNEAYFSPMTVTNTGGATITDMLVVDTVSPVMTGVTPTTPYASG